MDGWGLLRGAGLRPAPGPEQSLVNTGVVGSWECGLTKSFPEGGFCLPDF